MDQNMFAVSTQNKSILDYRLQAKTKLKFAEMK
jgi:hypothetical protein